MASVINCQDLEILDISDVEEDDESNENGLQSLNRYKSRPNIKTRLLSSIGSTKGEPITTWKAIELKQLVLGSALNQFTDEWRNQYFEFNENKSLYYGLVQRKGGPCGVLASIQAYVIIELFFNSQNTDQQITSDLLVNCLAKAISNILWKIGRKTSASVAHETNSIVMQRNSEICLDGITEHIVLNTFDSYESLYSHVLDIIQKNPKSIGCVSFLFSCILSRGCDQVRQDFDDPNTSLIGRHNYCTQEMVNLFLIGRAVSNVFNNDIKCDSLTLHGVFGSSQIGFLSLYEYYKSFEVGSNYKCPQYPIYVILSESHFSLLFSKCRIENRQQFELFYYDGLSLQEEEIILTIKLDKNQINEQEVSEDKTIVPLECVIRTKWTNALIVWNTRDKIL